MLESKQFDTRQSAARERAPEIIEHKRAQTLCGPITTVPIAKRFPIPANDDDFERLSLELLRRHWSRPALEIFGKRGERQFGIDILDVSGETPYCAAQCKLKEEHKSLRPAEIQAEVDKAKQFTPPLGKYCILTTGKISTRSQRKVHEINMAHRAAGLFEVELMPWDVLCDLLLRHTDIQEHFYGEIGLERAKRMEGHLETIRNGVESLTTRSAETSKVTIGKINVDTQAQEARELEGLELAWINGDVIGCDRFVGRRVGLVEVTNGTLDVPMPAFDLTGFVRYQSSAGQEFTVTDPAWWEITHDSTMAFQGWKPRIEKLESGQTQYFVLIARDDDGTEWAVASSGDVVGQLDYARWELTIQVTSRNVPGRELVISYLRRQYGGAPMPHVIGRRRLPPRTP